MANYLARALKLLGADEDDVLKHRLQGDEYIVILDLGIKGCPKYRVPLAQLPELGPPVVVEETPDDEGEIHVHVCGYCLREFDSARGLTVHQSRFCDALRDEEE